LDLKIERIDGRLTLIQWMLALLTRHRDLRTMRGYVRRASLLTESPAGVLDL
jgi:hypothetical protein